MLKVALWLSVPVAVIAALVASARDAAYNPTASDELLGIFFWAHLSADFVTATFVIWLLGRVGLAVWRRLRRATPNRAG